MSNPGLSVLLNEPSGEYSKIGSGPFLWLAENLEVGIAKYPHPHMLEQHKNRFGRHSNDFQPGAVRITV